MVKFQSLLVE